MTIPILGIMTVYSNGQPPFPERSFFRNLIQAGHTQGIGVVVFHPDQVDFTTRTVSGYNLTPTGVWTTVTTPIPQYIYDRCFYSGRKYDQSYKPNVSRLHQDPAVQFLGIGLKGKSQMFDTVSQNPILKPFLPPTDVYSSTEQVKQWLSRYPAIILKPISGSLGIGVLKLTKIGHSLRIEGRGQRNTIIQRNVPNLQSFATFFAPYVTRWRYLIQPYLTLRSVDHIPFDIRILVQKNGNGQWSTTGKAIRTGAKNSVTSNLHGGGNAVAFTTFMNHYYTPLQITTIREQLHTLEQTLPAYLEQQLGPLVELGIDIGIDQNTKVWLIEVNSKPGREVFERLKERRIFLNAQLNPLKYTKYLIKTRNEIWQNVSRREKTRKRKRMRNNRSRITIGTEPNSKLKER